MRVLSSSPTPFKFRGTLGGAPGDVHETGGAMAKGPRMPERGHPNPPGYPPSKWPASAPEPRAYSGAHLRADWRAFSRRPAIDCGGRAAWEEGVRAAIRRSLSSTALQRSKNARVRCPDIRMTTDSDTPSALHPQTLLAWALNDEPLTVEHGAPLRLVIPVKYGIKNLKRIGALRWTDEQPADYWAEQGYDWFAGL